MPRTRPSGLIIAASLSVLLHGAILAPVAMQFAEPPPDMPDQVEQGSIELLPVEMVGADTSLEQTRPEPVPEQPTVQAGLATDTPPPDDPKPDDPDGTEQAAPEQPRPEPDNRPAAAPPSKALAFNLEGTDSASNAIVFGENVIPASPDDRGRNRPPVYPREAVRRGDQGTVTLVIHVSPLGLAAGADIVQSSGHAILDRAAVEAVLAWRFRPAIRNGQAIAFDMPMQFVFSTR